MEVRGHLVLAVVGHRIADGARPVAHGQPAHDHQADAADAQKPLLALDDELLDDRETKGRDRAEHGIAQRRADAGHVARDGADRDRAAEA